MKQVSQTIVGEIALTNLGQVFPREFYVKDDKIVKLIFIYRDSKLEIDNLLGLWYMSGEAHLTHALMQHLKENEREYVCRLAIDEERHFKYDITEVLNLQRNVPSQFETVTLPRYIR